MEAFVVEVDDAASAENETPDANLVVTGTSENGTLIDSNDIFITPHGDANKRNVFLFTSGTGSGSANIVLTVTDGANATGTTRFQVNVSDSPEIGGSDTNSINGQGNINVAAAQIDQPAPVCIRTACPVLPR